MCRNYLLFVGRELELNVLTGELLVDRGEGVDSALKLALLLRVKEAKRKKNRVRNGGGENETVEKMTRTS
jgi:hypothetical protein